MNRTGYFFVEEDEENSGTWNVRKTEYYEQNPTVASFPSEEEAQKEADQRNELIKVKMVATLLDELAQGLVVDSSCLTLKSFSYNDPTYEVEFENQVGSEFTFFQIYCNEESGEILQRGFTARI
jgi:hypothetical protein